MVSQPEYFFICPLVVCASSLDKFIFMSFYRFLLGWFLSLQWNFLSSLYILAVDTLLTAQFANIFSYSVAGASSFVECSLLSAKESQLDVSFMLLFTDLLGSFPRSLCMCLCLAEFPQSFPLVSWNYLESFSYIFPAFTYNRTDHWKVDFSSSSGFSILVPQVGSKQDGFFNHHSTGLPSPLLQKLNAPFRYCSQWRGISISPLNSRDSSDPVWVQGALYLQHSSSRRSTSILVSRGSTLCLPEVEFHGSTLCFLFFISSQLLLLNHVFLKVPKGVLKPMDVLRVIFHGLNL